MIERVVDPDPVELPIFELSLVLLPTELVPLHIFEPRYRRMIAHCLDEEKPFGIVFRDDDGPRDVGCTAEVSEVVERFDDGRLNIVVTGGRPFRLIERYELPEYPAARAQPLDPGTEPLEGDAELAAREAFNELLEAVAAEAEPPEEPSSAFDLAARVELPVAFKQRLLESDSERERLRMLGETFVDLTERLQRAREVAEIAQGNGHRPAAGP
jgi:Lon protease-like protein